MVCNAKEQKRNLQESIRQSLRNLAASRKRAVTVTLRYYTTENYRDASVSSCVINDD